VDFSSPPVKCAALIRKAISPDLDGSRSIVLLYSLATRPPAEVFQTWLAKTFCTAPPPRLESRTKLDPDSARTAGIFHAEGHQLLRRAEKPNPPRNPCFKRRSANRLARARYERSLQSCDQRDVRGAAILSASATTGRAADRDVFTADWVGGTTR